MIAYAITMSAAAAGLAMFTPERVDRDNPFGSTPTFVAIMVLFGVAEYAGFHVHFGRDGFLFSFNEIPMAFAVVYLSPFAGLASRLILVGVVLAVVRGNRYYKLLFNLALITFELAMIGMVYHSLVRWWGDGQAAAIAAMAVSLMVVTPLTSVLIGVAVALYQGAFGQPILRGIRATVWLYTINSVLAAMILALVLINPGLTALAVLPIGGMWYVLHSYGVLGQQLRDLDAEHGFTGRIGDTLDVGAIGDVATEEAMRVFRADGALLIMFTEPGTTHSTGRVRNVTPTVEALAKWRALVVADEVSVVDAARLPSLGVVVEPPKPTMMVAPISGGGEPLAVLAVTRDDSPPTRFDANDRARMRNIGEQLSVSLRRGMLHERLEWEARHDALTGLPARTLFEKMVADATASDDDSGTTAVMMLDLDRFKEVNDTLGHHAGDALLIEFSRRIESVLGPDDYLARLAGDEFAILCRRSTIDEVRRVAQVCVDEGGRPVTLDGLEIVVTVSVGVAELGPDDDEALQPMRRADIAMYNAKWQRSGVEFYRDEIDRRTPTRLSMLGDLRAAIETDELSVVYQPKLDLATQQIVGVEALVRWDHPVRGVVPPTEFVRVAEDTGLIKQLTDLVLSSGIGMLARLQEARLPVGLAVNLSTHDLFDSRLPDRVRDYLRSQRVDPSLLTLEITESSLFVDAPRTRATLDDLFAVGLRLSVDDFGTGYSSLSYLRRLPVSELKIDQSFVAGMLADEQDAVIVRSTVDLGHNLGLQVVAEGVESLAVLRQLTDIGCDIAQGYAISKPLTADEIVEWLEQSWLVGWRPLD